MQIHLLSGPIHSGKTTSLLNYIEQNTYCSGILTPIIEGERYFFSIETQRKVKMVAENSEHDVYKIGKYKFSKSAFEWAINHLKNNLALENELLIIDEIGPLELKGEGFADLLTLILSNTFPIKNLLLVVRETILSDVLLNFKIEKSHLKIWDYQPYKLNE